MNPDLNNDGTVDALDLSILLSRWGGSDAEADLNADGTVDAFDLSALLSKWGMVNAGSLTIKVVVKELDSLSAGDRFIRDRLEASGHSVTLVDQYVMPDATGFHALVISESIGSSNAAPYKEVGVGILCLEPFAWDDLGLAQTQQDNPNETNFRIVDDSSPLAGGLGAGSHMLTETGASLFSAGNLASEAMTVATLDSDINHSVLFAYESSALGIDGIPFPARRVGYGTPDLTIRSMSEEAWTLFDAAVNWVAIDV